MRHTLTLIIVGAAVPMLAAAQVPPAAPVPATPPASPAPAAKPAAPKPPKPSEAPHFGLLFSPKFELDYQLELMGPKLEEARWRAEEMRLHAVEMSMLDVEHIRRQAEEMAMISKVDVEHIKAEAEAMKQLSRIDVDKVRRQAEEMSRAVLLDMPMKLEGFGPGMGNSDKFLDARPRAAWSPQDPADSLYRVAREALNRGEYRRAAQMFNEVTKKFPKSRYAVGCAYWEAFARYRVGSTEDLRQALRILDEGRVQFAQLRSNGESSVDVQALRARVQGALAARGDEKAAEELRREAGQNSGCDREEVSVRAEALGALGQMDAASALPVVKKVLARRDECTVELRRRALYVLGRHQTAEAVPIILDVAKNDTDAGIRGEAMRWLPRVAGDAAVPQLEELLRTSTDEPTQRSVIGALGSIDSDAARRAIRTIIERNDAAERVRYDAIITLSRERDGRAPSADEATYVRSLYTKLESARLREAVLTSASRVATPENEQFLLGVARNVNETPSLRAAALQRLGRMSTVGVAEIAKLYDVADSRSLREQILSALSQRKEPEAIDKLIEIARKDTDPQIRSRAISYLQRSNNERAKQFILGIFDR